VADPYSNPLHNLLVDIDTSLPLLTLPVKAIDGKFNSFINSFRNIISGVLGDKYQREVWKYRKE